MQQALRPYVATGVALVGAGMVAVAPIATQLPDAHLMRDVALTATDSGIDLFGPWSDAFNTASSNASEISGAYFNAPFAVLQQLVVNQFDHLDALIKDPGSVGEIFTGIGDNLKDVFQTSTLLGLEIDPSASSIPEAITQSNDAMHSLALMLLPMFLPSGMDEQTTDLVTQLVHVLASPLSGVALGMVSPLISPVVALGNSVGDIVGHLSGDEADPTAALQDLLATPANMVDGFLNGANLDLSALLPAINDSGLLPVQLGDLGFAFGGLLSTGATALPPGSDEIGDVTGVGGSFFNSLTLSAMGFDIPGHGIGPIGAMENLAQMIAGALGWDGDGNPLADLSFPELDFGEALSLF